MKKNDKDTLLCAISIVEDLYHTANPVEICKYLKIEFELECTVQDIDEAYAKVESQFCFADLDSEDYRINYKTCGL